MKKNKFLKSSISISLALSLGLVVIPQVFNDNNVVIADYKDTPASDSTKKQLLELADKVLNNSELHSKFLGTGFLHEHSSKEGYYLGEDKEKIPFDVITTTAWYNVWSEAAKAKEKINTYTEKLAKNAINNINYYNNLYAFDMSKNLTEDGLFKGNFKMLNMNLDSGNINSQAFYSKNSENEEIKKLFNDNVEIIKLGNNLRLTFKANDKISDIKSVSFNKIATIKPRVSYGVEDSKAKSFSVEIPGELKVEQLVIDTISYTDSSGSVKKVENIGIDINYANLVKDGSYMDNDYKKYLNEKIERWINRGDKATREILVAGEDDEQIAKIKDVITRLEQLKRDSEASYNKMYALVEPIYDIENKTTLKEYLATKLSRAFEDAKIYKEDTYTKESLAELNSYLVTVDKEKDNKSLVEIVGIIEQFNNAATTILKYNTAELERLVKLAEEKNQNDYTEETWLNLSQEKLKAKDWLKQTTEYKPQFNETSDREDALRKVLNSLERKDGKQIEKVEKPKKEVKKEQVTGLKVNVRFTTSGNSLNHRFNSLLEQQADLVERADGKNELILTFKPSIYGTNNINEAIVDMAYNKSGVQENVEKILVDSGTHRNKSTEYLKKVKLIVDNSQPRVTSELKVVDDLSAFGNSTERVDLLIDYSSKVGQGVAKVTDKNKEKLKEQLEYFYDDSTKENYKNLDSSKKITINSLVDEANSLIDSNEKLTDDKYNEISKKLYDEDDKLMAFVNTKFAYDLARDNVSLWKEQANKYEANSLKKIEDNFNKLKERYKEITTKEQADELTGQFDSLQIMLLINTTEIERRVSELEKKLADESYIEESKVNLRNLINSAKGFIAEAKKEFTEDYSDLFLTKLNYAEKDLVKKQSDKEQVDKTNLINKLEEAKKIVIGKKTEDEFSKLQNEIAKADEIVSDSDVTKENVDTAIINLTTAINNFNSSLDKEEKPQVINNEVHNIKVSLEKLDGSLSMANATLVETAKYVVNGNDKFIELMLKPLTNNGNATGVLGKLSYYKDGVEIDSEVIEKETITLNVNGQSGTYEYPTKVRIPLDEKVTKILVNTYSFSPLFGSEAHVNNANLAISYPISNENTDNKIDKTPLSNLLLQLSGKYYESYKSYFTNNAIWQDFVNKSKEAKKLLEDKDITKEQVENSYNDLLQAKKKVDLLILVANANNQLDANYKSDANSNKYTKESLENAHSFITNINKEIIAQLNANTDDNKVLTLLEKLENYYLLLRFDTSELASKLDEARKKLEGNYTNSSKDNLREIVEKAEQYIEQAKETKKIADIKEQLKMELDSAINSLEVENNNTVNELDDKENKREKLDTFNLTLALSAIEVLLEDDSKDNTIAKEQLEKLTLVYEEEKRLLNEAKSQQQLDEAVKKLQQATEYYIKNKFKKQSEIIEPKEENPSEKEESSKEDGKMPGVKEETKAETSSEKEESPKEDGKMPEVKEEPKAENPSEKEEAPKEDGKVTPTEEPKAENPSEKEEAPKEDGKVTPTEEPKAENPSEKEDGKTPEVKEESKENKTPIDDEEKVKDNKPKLEKVAYLIAKNNLAMAENDNLDKSIDFVATKIDFIPQSLLEKDVDVYDLSFVDKLTRKVKTVLGKTLVTLPKKKKVKNVYYVDDNGLLTKLPFKEQEKTVTFEVDHFSKYAVEYDQEKINIITNDNLKSTENNKELEKNTLENKVVSLLTSNNSKNKQQKSLAKTGLETNNYLLISLVLIASCYLLRRKRK